MRMTRAFVATATATALVLGGVSAPAFAEDGQSSNTFGSATGGSSTLNNLSSSLTGSSQATKNVSDATVKGTQGVDSGSAKISGLSSASSDEEGTANAKTQTGGKTATDAPKGNDLSAKIPGGPVGAAIGVIILLMLLNGGKNGQGGLNGISSTISAK